MGDARRHGTHGLHLVGLAELRFQPDLLADVPDAFDQMGYPAAFVSQGAKMHVHQDAGFIPCDLMAPEVACLSGAECILEPAGFSRFVARTVQPKGDLMAGTAQDFFFSLPAQGQEILVHVSDQPVPIQDEDFVFEAPENGPAVIIPPGGGIHAGRRPFVFFH